MATAAGSVTSYSVQRVVTPHGLPCVNAFRHEPGHPEQSFIEVAPGGNTVRSYLDIEAGEATTVAELLAVATKVAGGPSRPSLPVTIDIDGMKLSFGCDLALAPAWREELLDLARYLSQPRPPEKLRANAC